MHVNRTCRFGGVVGINIDPFYFTNFYKQVSLGRNSVVGLIGLDGVMPAMFLGVLLHTAG